MSTTNNPPTSTSEALWSSASIAAAQEDADRLSTLLQSEFDALKSRDLTAFDALQLERGEVLTRLAQVADLVSAQAPVPDWWQALLPGLAQCKQDHLRNIQLLQRQMQAVKGALQALQGETAVSVDLYDRLGQVSRRQGVVAYLAA
ncbi:flagellar protein FlgN [Limnohabitans sp. Rim28]|uniref:flagellar protein FlgN n=1 Tax=Limnohabitans sp. Rim28 TaxID=1100720 RepID=UPI001EDDE2BD|nr:flagellar protein FlgN [Limnohabitans sp. Rim28]